MTIVRGTVWSISSEEGVLNTGRVILEDKKFRNCTLYTYSFNNKLNFI